MAHAPGAGTSSPDSHSRRPLRRPARLGTLAADAPRRHRERRDVTPDPRRILVVDDIEDSRDLYAFYLNHVGYHVTVALDGETAIRLAQQQRFDIIVMDLAMPKMDGVEATRCLKTDERTRQIPIIIVSGHAMHGLAGAARAAGAEGYCMKPCSPEALEREIERVLAGGAAPRPD